MTEAFYWLGVAVATAACIAAAFFGGAIIWYRLIDGRFGAIIFRKTQRRMSIAVWHRTKLVKKGDQRGTLEDWPADDWPINERPFYLSMRLGKRRLFLLSGILDERRANVIGGTHP